MEFAQATVHKSGNQLHVSHGDDSGLYVEFYMKPEHQAFKSEKEGYPVYEDIPYVRIIFPGDSTKKVDRPVNMNGTEFSPSDIERWPRQWAAFKNQSVQVSEGLPIDEWPPITKSLAMSLKAMSIHTVQQLAGVSDTALTWMGARDLREKAKAYLASASDSASVLKMQSDLQNAKNELEAMKKQFAELASEKRRGRPPKEVNEDAEQTD